MELSGLERFQRFEFTLPFYRTRIDIFEGRVKRFVNGKNSVTLKQLRYAFKEDSKWSDLSVEDSILCKLISSEYFQDEKAPEEINIHSLILYGLMLCPGDMQLKARVFYDILQDSLQETISANDKDFKETLNKMIEVATKMTYKFEAEYDGSLAMSDDKINEDLLETLSEGFLDEIFGANAKLPRKEHMNLVATKQNWIFSAKQIREKVDKA